MGYCVEIELRNVKFKKEHWKEVREKLVKWNEGYLKPNSDWLRFDSSLETAEEIFEDMRYSAGEFGDYIEIGEFEGEKLGSDEEMFEMLAPYLEDCEIVYEGEDGNDWKQTIKDGKVSVVERERL
jgi:hypothetical protein